MATIYFSHPSLSYHTDTEEKAIIIMKRDLGAKKIINPYDYKRKDKEKLGQMLKDSDMVVGMSVYGSYPYIVWNDLEYGISLEKRIFTLDFPVDRASPFKLAEGVDVKYKKLSPEETDSLYKDIMKEDSKGIISTLFLGKLGKRSVF